MTIKANTFEGISGATDGLALTGSLTAGGGDQITIAGTSSRWTLRTGGLHGTYAARCARNSAGSGENPVMLYTLATMQGSSSIYLKLSALPSVISAIEAFSNASGFAVTVFVTTTGGIRIDAGGTTLTTLSAGMQAGRWYRIDLGVVVGTTTSNGAVRCAVGLRDRTTPIVSYTNTACNTGTVALTNWQWGAPVASSAAAFNEDWDDPRLDDSIGTLIGAHGYTAAGSGRFDEVLANPGSLTATTDFLADLQDGSASTGVTSPGVSVNELIEYSIPPMSAGSFTGSFKALWVDGANSMRLTLRQGSTPTTPGAQVATRLYSLTNTEAPYPFAATGSENAAITDWADLSMQVAFNAT